MKTCSKCKKSYPASTEHFYSDRSKKSGFSSCCRNCQKARSRLKYATDPEKAKAENKAYYQKNKERFLKYGRDLRDRVLTEYGGKCMCCGETTKEFLGIDHVRNDGETHRKELGAYGRSIYRWLEQNGYPKDGRFQLLCHNCNMAKGLYGGCPHQGTPPGRRQQTTRWTKTYTPAVGDSDG